MCKEVPPQISSGMFYKDPRYSHILDGRLEAASRSYWAFELPLVG